MPLLPDQRKDAAGCPVLIFSSDGCFIDHHHKILASLGFIPIATTTPEAALAVLRLEVIALVIVDEGDGLINCQKILTRAQETQRHAPVLVVGRCADPKSRCKTLALGAVKYLEHPAFRDDVVQAFLPGFRARSRARRSAYGSQQE